MNKTKIENIDTLVSTKFVSLYDVRYINKNNKERHWTVASRKSKEELSEIYLNNKEDKIDAVVVVAYHKEEKKLVLIKQFRVPINKYIYELPAGLVDNGENIINSVKRELKEETGLDLKRINKIQEKLYLSPGMTDESVALVYCTCSGKVSKEYLEEDEDIEVMLVSKDEAINIVSGNDILDIKAHLQLQLFIEMEEKMFL